MSVRAEDMPRLRRHPLSFVHAARSTGRAGRCTRTHPTWTFPQLGSGELRALLLGNASGAPAQGERALWIVFVTLMPVAGPLVYLIVHVPRREISRPILSAGAAVIGATTGAVLDRLLFVTTTCTREEEGLVLCTERASHVGVVAVAAVAIASLVYLLSGPREHVRAAVAPNRLGRAAPRKLPRL